MINQCFIEQPTTRKILQDVTSVCTECYRTLKEGEKTYYDMEHYRYLCEECARRLCEEKLERERESIRYEEEEEVETPGLF